MLSRRHILSAAALAVLAQLPAMTTRVRAEEPLATAGIGLQVCSKLTASMKPAEGLNNQANYLVYYWVQGYLSAANIATLEADGNYIDLRANDETKIIPMVFDFCTKNPDKKPISVIDSLLETAPRLKGEWVKGVIPWAAE